MSDAQTERGVAAIVAAFVEADFDRGAGAGPGGSRTEGCRPRALLDDGLVAGIREVGEMFRREEVYLPEMMLAAEAWQAGMDVLEPLLARRGTARRRQGQES